MASKQIGYPRSYVVIVSKDEREDLVNTVHSIHATNARYSDYGVICLDDGDGGDAKLILDTKFKKQNVVPVFPSPMDWGDIFNESARDTKKQRMGPNRARNYASNLLPASVDFLIFCDAHLTFQTKGWIKKIAKHFDENPDTGIVTCNMNGGKGMYWDTSTFEVKWNVVGDDPVIKTTGSPAGFLAIRNSLFKTVLGFNPLYPSYGIDEELSLRVWRMGYDIDALTDLKVDHKFKKSLDYKVDYTQVVAQQYMGAQINLPKTTSLSNLILYHRDNFGGMLVEDILGRIKGSDTFVYANHFQSLFKRTEDEFNQLNDRLLSAHSYTIKIPKNYHIMSQTTNKTESSDTLATAERVFTSPSGHKQSFYVKVVNPLAVLPEAPREGDSGIDLRACLPQDVTIQPLKRVVIPTGIAVRVPWGYEVQIRSRSGLAAKHGVFVLNSPATIDNSYQGELMVILFNTGDTDFHIHHGDRIAQMVVAPYYAVTDVIKTDEFETTTSRGDKGLGSTGVK